MFGKKEQPSVDPYAHKKCDACHFKGQPRACPCWVEPQAGVMETNIQTGEERFITGCFYQVIPKLMMHVVAASNRPAAAFEDLRNHVHKTAQVMAGIAEAEAQIRGLTHQPRLIGKGEE